MLKMLISFSGIVAICLSSSPSVQAGKEKKSSQHYNGKNEERNASFNARKTKGPDSYPSRDGNLDFTDRQESD